QLHVLRLVDPPMREQTKARRTDGEDVRPPIDLVHAACRLLGRHVRRRPEGEPELRLYRALGQTSETEVEKLNLLFGVFVPSQKDVRWLQIAMHDAVLVRGLEDGENALGDREKLGLAEGWRASGAVLERLALEELHHDVRGAAVRALLDDIVVQHLHGTGM